MAKNNNAWLWIGIVVVAIIVIYSKGGIGTFVITSDKAAVQYNENAPQNYNYYVTLNINPTTICVGGITTGSIASNMPNALCTIYTNTGSGYNLFSNAQLNANGQYSASSAVNSVGSALFRVICLLNGEYRISNEASLTVNNCVPPAQTCEDKAKEEGAPFWIEPKTGPECLQFAQIDCQQKGQVLLGWAISGTCCYYVCEPQGETCTDSDGGQVFTTWGVCSSSVTQTSIEDWCSGAQIVERYCGADKTCQSVTANCPAGTTCMLGNCVHIDTPQEICADSCVAKNNLGFNFHTGGCFAYNPQGAMSMAQTCQQNNGVYANAAGCDAGDICCCR